MGAMEIPKEINLQITEAALVQINLLAQNDYTLEGMSFRIKIGGKGCGGFTYETGFSLPRPDDLHIAVQGTTILMDPFTAVYTQQCSLDYKLEAETGDEGFIVENFAGDKYKGKFFKDASLVPQLEKP
jgi:Fe-S cluster assembly iron-binding protein IscA